MEKKENVAPPRILLVLYGDIVKSPEIRTKYYLFLKALDSRFQVMGVYNAKLSGLQRLWNLIKTWHPNLRIWRERALKNSSAFITRSKKAANWIRSKQGQADLVIQLGVLFDVGWGDIQLPKIIYTDYTARLSARHRASGRSPLEGPALLRWFKLEETAMRQSVYVCVRSQLVGESVLEDYQLPKERVGVIGGGINLEPIPEFIVRPEKKNPTILFIGLDYYRQGGDLVLRAFSSALASVPNARLIFVTKGPIPEDMPMKGVEIIPPIWEREEVVKLYEKADIFVLPSRLETWGDVLLEAMAYGLPCVGVEGQSMAEIIQHGETGLLVPPEDATALAAAFVELLGEQEMRHRMGLAGYKRVIEEFTWNQVVERLAPMIYNAVK